MGAGVPVPSQQEKDAQRVSGPAPYFFHHAVHETIRTTSTLQYPAFPGETCLVVITGKETIPLSSGGACLFCRVETPFLTHYFVLTFWGEPSRGEEEEMLRIALLQGRAIAIEYAGKPDAYTIIHSGLSVRRAKGWHVHVVVIRNRWEKAWLYLVLSGKNLLQALRLRRDTRYQRSPPVDAPDSRPRG